MILKEANLLQLNVYVNSYLRGFCSFSASHFIHDSKNLERSGKRVAWYKGQAVVVVRKNCRLKHVFKSQSPEDGRWILFHPLDSNSVVVHHVPYNIIQSKDPCFYSKDETSRATRVFCSFFFFFVIVVCIVLGFFSQSQMRYHLKYYARDQLTSSNTISFLHLFFFFC